jgi:Ca2+-binding RTX toxin-like protein
MATKKIGNRTTTFTPDKADTTYLLEKGKVVDATEYGIHQASGLDDMTFDIRGRVTSTYSSIALGDGGSWSDGLTIRVATSGRIDSGGRAIELYASNHLIENDGKISGTNGIRSSGADGVIDNSGEIIGTGAGIVVNGPHRVLNSGTISGGEYGIVLNDSDAGSGFVSNRGMIKGGGDAIQASDGDDKVVNSGTIKGDVELGGGEDTFVFKGGKVTGEVSGGMEGDRYVIHAEGVQIAESFGEGFDLVLSKISFELSANVEQLNLLGKADIDGTGNDQSNHIQGNAGSNVLRGEAGTDFLIGFAGNDRLYGGDDADVFNFQKGSGKDIVMDFEATWDEIQLGGLKGAKDFDDMKANHIEEIKGDLWITYGKDVVVLKNTDTDDLVMADFVFG